MQKHWIATAAILALLIALVGCAQAKPTLPPPPTKAVATTVARPMDTLTSVPATAVPKPTDVPTQVPEATEAAAVAEPTLVVAEGPEGPELLAPPNDLAATIIDLVWSWAEELPSGGWFEVHIWPDIPKVTPTPVDPDAPRTHDIFGWYKETQLRVTSASLLPGRYHWQVVVVDAKGEARSEELSPYSEERTFIINRPSVKANILIPSPTAPTATPTSTPSPTNTPRPYYPSPVPVSSATPTIVAPTAIETPDQPAPTNTTEPYAQPTNTPDQPAPTNTTEPYAGATNTPSSKATNTTAPVPTEAPTSAYPQPTQPAATTEPTSPAPTTEPTAYP